MPAINSPSKEVQSIPSRAPESTSVNLHRRDASKPASVAIHSKCCCRHHKQDDEQRAALKSRSLGSLQSKEVHPIMLANHFAKTKSCVNLVFINKFISTSMNDNLF